MTKRPTMNRPFLSRKMWPYRNAVRRNALRRVIEGMSWGAPFPDFPTPFLRELTMEDAPVRVRVITREWPGEQ